VRTAFGRFAGVQVGWFHLLAAGWRRRECKLIRDLFFPWAGQGIQSALLLALLISIPTVANYVGVRNGARLSNVLTVAKLTPLVLIITLGVARFSEHFVPAYYCRKRMHNCLCRNVHFTSKARDP
jgi:basic amino acid/polyamine antiporter, APA family